MINLQSFIKTAILNTGKWMKTEIVNFLDWVFLNSPLAVNRGWLVIINNCLGVRSTSPVISE